MGSSHVVLLQDFRNLSGRGENCTMATEVEPRLLLHNFPLTTFKGFFNHNYSDLNPSLIGLKFERAIRVYIAREREGGYMEKHNIPKQWSRNEFRIGGAKVYWEGWTKTTLYHCSLYNFLYVCILSSLIL